MSKKKEIHFWISFYFFIIRLLPQIEQNLPLFLFSCPQVGQNLPTSTSSLGSSFTLVIGWVGCSSIVSSFSICSSTCLICSSCLSIVFSSINSIFSTFGTCLISGCFSLFNSLYVTKTIIPIPAKSKYNQNGIIPQNSHNWTIILIIRITILA